MNEDTEKLIRLYILDTLVAHSGKPLLPELIGELTSELLGRIVDAMAHNDDSR